MQIALLQLSGRMSPRMSTMPSSTFATPRRAAHASFASRSSSTRAISHKASMRNTMRLPKSFLPRPRNDWERSRKSSGWCSSSSFYGESFVSDPFGEFLAQGGAAEIDWRRVRELRELFQFLRDRWVDTYGPLLKRVTE